MRNFIKWTEGHIARGRKIVLFATVAVFLLITIILFGAVIWGKAINDLVLNLYITFVGLMASVYGFYTGTSSDKSGKLAEAAADILYDKLEEMKNNKNEINEDNDEEIDPYKYKRKVEK